VSAGCGGACNQGRAPCDCELALELGPDDTRVIQPPKPAPQPDYRARAHYLALTIAAALYLAIAALLRVMGSRSFGA
jgi:hypothetical protein